MGLYENNFAVAFTKLLAKFGVTCYQIHNYTNLDQAYLSQLKNGGKNNPSAETIMKIGLAFCHCCDKVKLSNIEELFNSVGRSLWVK